MIGIVVSRADEASMSIRDQLLELADWTPLVDHSTPDPDGGGTVYQTAGFELREFDALHVHLGNAARPYTEPSCIVFASRHAGDSGAVVTTHFTGNFGTASLGGQPATLALACPSIRSLLSASLLKNAPDGYDVGIECTHHGPTETSVPSVFVEIGSDSVHWRDVNAARAVAKSILVLPAHPPITDHTLVGFGGGHYAPRFDRIARETDWVVGHIAADWSLEETNGLSKDIVQQVFAKSDAMYAVLDGDYPDLVATIKSLGYRVVSETFVRESSGITLGVVNRLEDTLSPIDSGLRLGTDVTPTGEFEVRDLPDKLFARINGIDMDRVRSVFTDHTAGFMTTENGNRVVGPFAVPDHAAFDALLDDLVVILQDRFDQVTRSTDSITVTERVFDPSAAQRYDVPEGPAYGRLASGEVVEVDGERITPDMVHTWREHQFRL